MALLALASSAQAQTRTWSNLGSDWNTAANWGGDVPDSVGEAASFPTLNLVPVPQLNPNISSSVSIARLTFSATGATGYTVSSSGGSTLTVVGTGTTTSSAINASNNSGTNSVSAPVIFGAAAASTQTINVNNSSGTLTLSGPISATNAITLSVTGPGALNVSNSISSDLTLSLANSGTVYLSGSNSYTGATLLASTGTVEFSSGGLSNGDVTWTNSNYLLRYAAGNAEDISGRLVNSAVEMRLQPNGNNVVFNSSIAASNSAGMVIIGTGGGSLTLAAANSYLGNTRLGTAALVNIQHANALSAGDLVFSGAATFDNTAGSALAVANGLNLDGGSATFTGTQDLTMNGAVALSGSRTLTVTNANATLTLAGSASGSGTLVKAGDGTLVLDDGGAYAGATSVNAGRLLVNGALNDSAVSVNSGGVLGGSGSVDAITLAAGGLIDPGASSGAIGTLSTDNGNFTWNGEASDVFAQMTFDLSNTPDLGLAATSDTLALGAGVFTKGAGSFFRFDFGDSGAFGNTYTLITFGSQAGFNAADFSYGGLASGLTGEFNLAGGSLQFTVVPEPSTVSIVLLGFALVALMARRRAVRNV